MDYFKNHLAYLIFIGWTTQQKNDLTCIEWEDKNVHAWDGETEEITKGGEKYRSLYTKYYLLEEKVIGIVRNFFQLDRTARYAFFSILLFTFLYILPIILANVYYNDDLARSYVGYLGWRNDGRPLMEVPFFLFNSSRKQVADFSPLLLIFAGAIFSYCLTLFCRRSLPKASWFGMFTVAACVYFNFFMLENLSYKYDTFGMIIALSLPFAAFSMPEEWPVKIKAPLLSLLLLCSLSLYQATIGAYAGLLLFILTLRIYRDESLMNIGKDLFWKIMILGMGAIIYKFLIVNFAMVPSQYSAQHMGILNPISQNFLAVFYEHITKFCALFYLYFPSFKRILPILLGLLGLSSFYLACLTYQKRKERKIVRFGIALWVFLTPAFLWLASFLLLCLLKKPIYASRVLLSFGVATLYGGFLFYQVQQKIRLFAIVPLGVLIITLASSSLYGNLLTRQEDMNRQVATYLVYDINAVQQQMKTSFNTLQLTGGMIKCRELQLSEERKPLLTQMVTKFSLGGGLCFRKQYIQHMQNSEWKIDDKGPLSGVVPPSSKQPLVMNEFYNITPDGDKLIITFKDFQK